MLHPLPVHSAPQITMAWLLKLRWVAALGQLLAVCIAAFALSVALPLLPALLLAGATALTNAGLLYWTRTISPASRGLIAGVLVLDTVLLTALLSITGGSTNPFSSLYLVHVALAAVVLGSRWAWGISSLALIGYAFLFLLPLPQPSPVPHAYHNDFSHHLYGMWLSFVITAALIAYFVTRIASALAQREEELARAQRAVAQHEKLASLHTLAAGAAHELGTPLATIAVVSKELERNAALLPQGENVAEDARLIRQEVERCRRILHQMSAKAGENAGESPEPVHIPSLLEEVRSQLGAIQSDRLNVLCPEEAPPAVLPRRVILQTLVNLVQNALDASDPESPVVLRAEPDGTQIRFFVQDQGEGMSPEVLARAGEPFFTTKPPGRGLGLGLFLGKNLAERLGGSLTLHSEPNAGTTACLSLPLAFPRENPYDTARA